MRYQTLAIMFVFCNSCINSTLTSENSSDLKRIEIALIDSLGLITVNIPMRYDTSFSWLHYSDCSTCHVQKYRLQTSIRPILKESGFYWDEPKDSVDRFTISHIQFVPISVNDTSMIPASHSYFKNDLAGKGMKILKDTIQKINDRYFSIFELENSDSLFRREVFAVTTFKGNFINFSFELMVSKDDPLAHDFFVNSTKSINSIHIY